MEQQPPQQEPEQNPNEQRVISSSEPVMDGLRISQSQQGIDVLLSPPVNGGILCNDAQGLCIGSRGTIDTSQSGIYTTLARLAVRLDERCAVKDQPPTDDIEAPRGEGIRVTTPLITIETDRSTVLVKELEGKAIVFRVPRRIN
jgi:hypothetical protein